jgi:hypothetical protein
MPLVDLIHQGILGETMFKRFVSKEKRELREAINKDIELCKRSKFFIEQVITLLSVCQENDIVIPGDIKESCFMIYTYMQGDEGYITIKDTTVSASFGMREIIFRVTNPIDFNLTIYLDGREQRDISSASVDDLILYDKTILFGITRLYKFIARVQDWICTDIVMSKKLDVETYTDMVLRTLRVLSVHTGRFTSMQQAEEGSRKFIWDNDNIVDITFDSQETHTYGCDALRYNIPSKKILLPELVSLVQKDVARLRNCLSAIETEEYKCDLQVIKQCAWWAIHVILVKKHRIQDSALIINKDN